MHGRLTKPELAAADATAARQRQTAATVAAASRGLETCTNILSPFCIRSEPPKHGRLGASWPTLGRCAFPPTGDLANPGVERERLAPPAGPDGDGARLHPAPVPRGGAGCHTVGAR